MQNYKVEVQNHSEAMEAQELFFNLGYSWFHKKFEAIEIKTPETIMCFENGALTTGIRGSVKHKQITIQELRAMVAPKQKEYLVKTNTGYTLQVLSDVVDGHDGIIEVPEGADTLAGDDNCNYFWKHSDSGKHEIIGCGKSLSRYPAWDSCEDSAKEWLSYFKDEYDMRILWKRKESLNDQVASAEKARQEQTQCKCSTKELHESELIDAGQKIIDGFTQPEELPFVDDEPKLRNIKIRVNGNLDKAIETIQSIGYWNCNFNSIPRNCYWLLGNENATVDYGSIEYLRDDENYVEYFVEDEPKGVDATLAEREAQYGSFIGVANTTGQLMSVLLNSKNGQTLPYAHQEALHMICSKMARIVNGDHNHLDSWHDIGGYAKLIENNIN